MTLTLGGDPEVTLVGTVHISRHSRKRVIETVTEHDPDIVAVELDERRYRKLHRDDPQNPFLDLLSDVLSQRISPAAALVKLVLTRGQARFDETDALDPGEADFLPAIDTARERGSEPVFIDDDGDATLNHLGKVLSPQNIINSLRDRDVVELISSVETFTDIQERHPVDFDNADDTLRWLETLPYDELERLFGAYEGLLPDGTFDHLLHDRNERMAGHIEWCRRRDRSVVAVMGRAHVPGVRQLLDAPTNIPDEYVVAPPNVPSVNE